MKDLDDEEPKSCDAIHESLGFASLAKSRSCRWQCVTTPTLTGSGPLLLLIMKPNGQSFP